jgi:hypothetical protein
MIYHIRGEDANHCNNNTVSNLYHDSCLVPKTHMENLISCRLEDFIFLKQIHPFESIFDVEPQYM